MDSGKIDFETLLRMAKQNSEDTKKNVSVNIEYQKLKS